MKIDLSYKQFDSLSVSFPQVINSLPSFRTKKEAIAYGKRFGCNSALRIEKRFECVWVVGKKKQVTENNCSFIEFTLHSFFGNSFMADSIHRVFHARLKL